MEKITRFVPLAFFIMFALFWFTENYMSLEIINYPALIAIVLLVVQLFVNNKIAGFAIGGAALLFSGYMLKAVVNDYATFGTFSSGMRVRGVAFCMVILMALLLIFHYIRYKKTGQPV